MHRVLERQLKRCLDKNVSVSSEWTALLELISDTYTHFDEDRTLLNRSLDLSSKEFLDNNRRLEATRVKVEDQAKSLALEVTKRTKDLNDRIAELEDVRKAMTNLLEDFEQEQKALAEAKAKDEAILVSIADGCIAVNESGEIILMNQMAQKMLGFTSQESIGRKWYEILHREDESGHPIPPDQGSILAAISTTSTSPIPTKIGIYYYVRKDNTRFPVAITIAPVMLEDKIIGAIEVFRDITKERNVDKAKTEFVSLASHQLRTPLSTISWYTEMLLTGDAGSLNEKQKKYIDEVYRSNRRMVELINALLNVSRLELGTFTIDPEPTDITNLMQSVIDEYKFRIDEKNIQFLPSFEKDIPSIQADQKLLRMIVQNLLSNAINYTPEKGTVHCTVQVIKRDSLVDNHRVNEDCIAIIISDTGYGIPQNQQDKIFNKLFRADNVREKNNEGTGLGLYIVKSILDHSGGTIWFRSEENKGTTFYVTVPLVGMKKKEGTKVLN